MAPVRQQHCSRLQAREELACEPGGLMWRVFDAKLCPPIPARGARMANTAAAAPEEQHFVLSHLSPSLAQRRLALAIVLALLVAFVITVGPLSTFQPGRIDAFIPTWATAGFVTDLITAVLLFAQFSIVRSRALAVL